MLQPPSAGEFQTLELLFQHLNNAFKDQGYSFSTLRSNITHNPIEIACDRSRTHNLYKNFSKTFTSRKPDWQFRIYARKCVESTTWTLEVKNPEHSHDATENIISYAAFRKFNEKEKFQIAQMYASLFIPRQIQAQ
ncbi:hypothetical protein O181_097063 [Austropuccinia psidii MF-1]|uniref:FAR1 domain-containing protein n=1 Tax=Austropuccinia psidii MF-1 TaxID=1389203 RepID=A0A9Q3J6R4_9BASI|nr:hypothetical protein [Austropuccinia psidii MF-1]